MEIGDNRNGVFTEIINNLKLEKQTCEHTIVQGHKREANVLENNFLTILWFKVKMKIYFIESYKGFFSFRVVWYALVI